MNPNARYEDHARNLHQRARQEYNAWIEGMTPAERANLKNMGLAEAPDDDLEVGGHSPYAASDLADSPLAKVDVDFAAEIDSPIDEVAERFEVSLDKAREILSWHQENLKTAVRLRESHYLGVIVGGLLSAQNPKLACAGIAFAARLDALNGLGCQREYARKIGISSSALSKVVKAWQRSLELTPSPHQKSERACKTYSEIGKTRHWRNQRLTEGLASKLLSKLKNAASQN